jgi:DNA-binding beta-propeller fold protein YncE
MNKRESKIFNYFNIILAVLVVVEFLFIVDQSALTGNPVRQMSVQEVVDGEETALDVGQTSSFTITLTSKDYVLSKDSEGYNVVNNLEFSQLRTPGDPELPIEIYNVLLPPGAEFEGFEITSQESEELGTGYRIRPALKPKLSCVGDVCGSEYEKVSPNTEIYDSDQKYPSQSVTSLGQNKMRKYDLLILEFSPLEYNPFSGKLTKIKSVTLKVNYLKGSKSSVELADTAMDDEAESLFVNYGQFKENYQPPIKTASVTTTYDYVIIAPRKIATSQGVDDLVAYRQSQGYSPIVVQLEDIKRDYSGADDAEKVRNYLKSNFITLGIRYVTLIGNYDTMPMRYCYWFDPFGQPNQLPTDWYYSDLTGTWDYAADLCGSGVGKTSSVYVGRIPLGSSSEVKTYVDKLIAYEQSIDSYKKRALTAPGEVMAGFSRYCHLAESIISKSLDPNGYTPTKIYEDEGDCPCDVSADYALDSYAVAPVWASTKFGIAYLDGHGSPFTTSSHICVGNSSRDEGFFLSNEVASLDSNYPAIVYNGACTTASPEVNSLGISMMNQFKAISYIGGWRNTWTGPNMETHYFDLLLNSKSPNSKALGIARSIEIVHNKDNALSFNLYGDALSGIGNRRVDISLPLSGMYYKPNETTPIYGTVLGTGFSSYLMEWRDEYHPSSASSSGITYNDNNAIKIEDLLGYWTLPIDPSKYRLYLRGYFDAGPLEDHISIYTTIRVGSYGTSDGKFVTAQSTEYDDGELFVADRNDGRVQVFDQDGNFLRKWDAGSKALGIDVANNEVFVSDETQDKIKVFDKQGNLLRQWGSAGTGNGQFDTVTGLAVSGNEVYTVDTVLNRIQVFDKNGNFLRRWGQLGTGNSDFTNPWGIDVAGNEVFVVDNLGFPEPAEVRHNIKVFDRQGNFLRRWGYCPGDDFYYCNMAGISVRGNEVYLADEGNDKVKVFDKQGNFLREFGIDYGNAPGEMKTPYDIALSEDRMFVVEYLNFGFQIFGANYTELICSDGTPYGNCSITKPLFCANGVLINQCGLCGCVSGKTCSSNGACVSSSSGCYYDKLRRAYVCK